MAQDGQRFGLVEPAESLDAFSDRLALQEFHGEVERALQGRRVRVDHAEG